VTATVLLVEDESDTREILGGAIERSGYQCLLAADAAEAMQRATSAVVDAVVTDVVLGSDDRAGLRLLTDLRACGLRAPVIVITAFADLEKVKFALNAGAAHLLEKPFRAPELLDAIRHVLARGPEVSRSVDRILSRASLTDKERTVLRHLFNGLSSTEIAEIERNSPKTIRQHVSRIYAKCGVASRAELFRLLYIG
jgi:DNA-binding NarL/FixJ family response regulator